jgi:prepilin-type N-terminal cleavage/methylation domain-containing protein
MRRQGKSRPSYGFTLIELLVVIAIIAILVAMLLPAVQQVREAARKSQCQDHLHNLVLALHDYESSHKMFPNDTWTYFPQPGNAGGSGARCHSWMTLLLPFIEQKPLYDAIDFSQPLLNQTDGSGQKITAVQIDLLTCPSDQQYDPSERYDTATTNYAGSQGFDWWRRFHQVHEGWFSLQSRVRMQDVKDGTSNTICLGEVASNGHKWGGRRCGGGVPRFGGPEAVFRMWAVSHTHMHVQRAAGYDLLMPDGQPASSAPIGGEFWKRGPHTWGPLYIAAHCVNSEWPGPGSVHPGGAQFCMGDGQVKFIGENIDYHGDYNGSPGNLKSLWMSLNTINGASNDSIVKVP